MSNWPRRPMRTLADLKNHPRFAELRQTVDQAGSDSTSVFGGARDGGYHVQQQPDEFAALLCLLLERCRPIGLYGEIGSAAGGCLRLMYEAVGFDHVIVIDDSRHPKWIHHAENTKTFHERCEFLWGDSHSEGIRDELARRYTGAPFDVVFIDGDHSYEGVKADIELVKPYCTPATLLIFHDTRACPGVEKAFAELKYPLAEFVSEEKPLGIGVALAGV